MPQSKNAWSHAWVRMLSQNGSGSVAVLPLPLCLKIFAWICRHGQPAFRAGVPFQTLEISITRSIVMQVVGPCKTEASQKPIPLDAHLAEALQAWRQVTRCRVTLDTYTQTVTHQKREAQSNVIRLLRPSGTAAD